VGDGGESWPNERAVSLATQTEKQINVARMKDNLHQSLYDGISPDVQLRIICKELNFLSESKNMQLSLLSKGIIFLTLGHNFYGLYHRNSIQSVFWQFDPH